MNCPHCEKEVSELSYTVPVSGVVQIGNDESSLDHYDTARDWAEEPKYFCRGCGAEITPSDLESMGITA